MHSIGLRKFHIPNKIFTIFTREGVVTTKKVKKWIQSVMKSREAGREGVLPVVIHDIYDCWGSSRLVQWAAGCPVFQPPWDLQVRIPTIAPMSCACDFPETRKDKIRKNNCSSVRSVPPRVRVRRRAREQRQGREEY